MTSVPDARTSGNLSTDPLSELQSSFLRECMPLARSYVWRHGRRRGLRDLQELADEAVGLAFKQWATNPAARRNPRQVAIFSGKQALQGRKLCGNSRASCYGPRGRRRIRQVPAQLDGSRRQSRLGCEGAGVDDWAQCSWRNLVDKRADPADLAALHIDVQSWLATLSEEKRALFCALVFQGLGTTELARIYGLTRGRVSQKRRELAESLTAYLDTSNN